MFNSSDGAMNWWRNHFEWQYLRDNHPSVKGRMLNFGCGSGHSDVLLIESNRFDSIVGIDLDPVRINICKEIREKLPEETKKRLDFHLLDLCKDDLSVLGKFDACWSSHVMEHILDHTCVFANLKKVMNPGARMFISVPLGYNYDDKEHVHHWADEHELRKYFSQYDINIVEAYQTIGNNVLRMIVEF